MSLEQILQSADPNVLVAAVTVVLATLIYGECHELPGFGSKEQDAWPCFLAQLRICAHWVASDIVLTHLLSPGFRVCHVSF